MTDAQKVRGLLIEAASNLADEDVFTACARAAFSVLAENQNAGTGDGSFTEEFWMESSKTLRSLRAAHDDYGSWTRLKTADD